MKIMHRIHFIPLLLVSVMLPFLLTGCHRNAAPISKTGFYFNTVISITLYDSTAQHLLDEAFALCDSYEKMLSRTVEGSDIYRINHSEGKPVTVSEETALLLSEALRFSEMTGGKTDLTIAPLMDLWDFTSEKQKRVPDENSVSALLPHIDYRFVEQDDTSVRLLDPEAQIDLGFIAKGYIADRIKQFLTENGIESALIDLGGNVLTVGSKPDGQPFRIGIQKPFSARGTAVMQLPVHDSSLVSSGTYERFFEEDGQIYHHILDPKTGYPCENGLTGVTILSESSMLGDGLSTSCLLLGLEKGMDLIESIPNVEAVFIDEKQNIHLSSGLQ